MALNTFGLVVNLLNVACSMYKGYDFNSLCVDKSGRLLAAGDGGIYEVGGDTDDGELIPAFFELPTNSFGSDKVKRIREVIVTGETDGELFVSTLVDDADNRRVVGPLEFNGNNRQGSSEVVVDRAQEGVHWSIGVGNSDSEGITNGADFSVDSISVMMIVLNKLNVRYALRRG